MGWLCTKVNQFNLPRFHPQSLKLSLVQASNVVSFGAHIKSSAKHARDCVSCECL
jgi:hypothetical protein